MELQIRHCSHSNRIDEYLSKLGFVKSLSESTLYIKGDQANFIVISLYVDDLLVTGSNVELIQQFKDDMMQVFKMTNLGEMSYFLGMEIKQNEGEFIAATVAVNQALWLRKMLNDLHLEQDTTTEKELSCLENRKGVCNVFVYVLRRENKLYFV